MKRNFISLMFAVKYIRQTTHIFNIQHQRMIYAVALIIIFSFLNLKN